jgi:hypothetical protein
MAIQALLGLLYLICKGYDILRGRHKSAVFANFSRLAYENFVEELDLRIFPRILANYWLFDKNGY